VHGDVVHVNVFYDTVSNQPGSMKNTGYLLVFSNVLPETSDTDTMGTIAPQILDDYIRAIGLE
jgi:hypothetical protein